MRSAIRICFVVMAFLTAGRATAAMVTVIAGSGGNNFSPASFTVNPGDTVRWVWASGFHNTSSVSTPAGATAWYSNLTSNDTVYSYVPTVSGLYKYTCTHHSGMDGQFFVTGCSYPAPPVIVSANGNTVCDGDTVQLSITALQGATYQWINGTTGIPFSNAPTLAVVSTGNYKALINYCGVDSVSAPFAVTVHALPPAAFTYAGTGLTCVFTNSTNTYSYSWNFGDGSPLETAVHPSHTYAAPGTYMVRLTAIDTNTGCADSFSTAVHAEAVGIATPARLLYTIAAAAPVWYLYTEAEVSLWFTDLYGRRLSLPVAKNGNQYRIDAGELPAGIYLVHIQAHSARATEKIVVTH